MRQKAVVSEIKDGSIVVRSIRKGACGEQCAMCGGCNAEAVTTKVYSDIDVNVGDSVVIESKTSYVLIALFFVFISPLIFPIVTYFMTSSFAPVISYLFIILSVIITVCFILFLSKSKWFNDKITPKILTIEKKK